VPPGAIGKGLPLQKDGYLLLQGMHGRLPVFASGEANLEFDAPATEAVSDAQRYYAPVVKSSRDARAAVLALPLDDEDKERAVLVVSELTTNAIVHAGGVVYLQIFRDGGHLRIEVADASPKPAGPIKVNLTSGRGLQMVEALSTNWGSELRSWGKVVWAEL
jgi:two-component sensor histidine kinase